MWYGLSRATNSQRCDCIICDFTVGKIIIIIILSIGENIIIILPKSRLLSDDDSGSWHFEH